MVTLQQHTSNKLDEKVAATPQTEIIELPLMVASRTTVLFILIASMFAAVQSLQLPPTIARLALTIFTIRFDAAVKFAMSDADTDRATFASAGRQATTTELCNVPTHDQC